MLAGPDSTLSFALRSVNVESPASVFVNSRLTMLAMSLI
jgi:hypothetical protein